MKFLLTTLLSLSFAANAYSITFSEVDTLKFVKGCRILIKAADEGVDDIGAEDGVVMGLSTGYLSGFLDRRTMSVLQHMANTSAGPTDYELLEKEFHHYLLPENFTPYILAKLIVNKVDSSPTILTNSPCEIVTITLTEEFKLKK